MNCYRCGEDREPAGYICQACLNVEEQEQMEEELREAGLIRHSPRDAIIAMLNGATLETANGTRVRFDGAECSFVVVDTRQPFYGFNSLFLRTEGA